ncbi:hypothetical protein BJ165DRAFT_380997 [Panaeolus papilionaceus]|nr:hypothetical protein BJ165DRAFT_380997 [Panaeolus papilionaceus]
MTAAELSAACQRTLVPTSPEYYSESETEAGSSVTVMCRQTATTILSADPQLAIMPENHYPPPAQDISFEKSAVSHLSESKFSHLVDPFHSLDLFLRTEPKIEHSHDDFTKDCMARFVLERSSILDNLLGFTLLYFCNEYAQRRDIVDLLRKVVIFSPSDPGLNKTVVNKIIGIRSEAQGVPHDIGTIIQFKRWSYFIPPTSAKKAIVEIIDEAVINKFRLGSKWPPSNVIILLVSSIHMTNELATSTRLVCQPVVFEELSSRLHTCKPRTQCFVTGVHEFHYLVELQQNEQGLDTLCGRKIWPNLMPAGLLDVDLRKQPSTYDDFVDLSFRCIHQGIQNMIDRWTT